MRLLLNESVWVMLGESGNHKLKSYPAYQGCSPRPAEKPAASSSLGSVDLRIFCPDFHLCPAHPWSITFAALLLYEKSLK